MRYGPDHKQMAREKILKAASSGFRKHGYGGIGVDGLAKAGGVTSGAFYGHFSSKDIAFQEALVSGLHDLRDSIHHLKITQGDAWLVTFIDFYLSERLTCDLSEACALQALSSDAIRAPFETKKAYEACLDEIIGEIAEGLSSGDILQRETMALALLSFLSGAVSTLRAMADPERARAMADSLRKSALRLTIDA